MVAQVKEVLQEWDDELEVFGDVDWRKLIKGILKGAFQVGDSGAKLLISMYYDLQNLRIAASNRAFSLENEAASDLMGAIKGDLHILESHIRKALHAYARTTPWGNWALQITGIGPVVAAGLCAYVDPAKFSSVGKVWRFAGLDPTMKWGKGEKRPYSPRVKQIAYHIGESIVRFQDKSEYGPLFKKRKAYEWWRNLNGLLAEQAAAMLPRATEHQKLWLTGRVDPVYAERVAKGLGGTATPELLPDGKTGTPMLPPLIIHARASRWVAKLVLSHFWEVRYWYQNGERPPFPYAVAHQGHTDYIEPPYAPWK